MVNGESDKSNQFHWPDVKVEGVGADYRKSHPVAWWLALVGPVVISAALLGCIALIQGFDVAYSYAAAAVSAFLFLGRFIILIGQNESCNLIGRNKCLVFKQPRINTVSK